MPAERTARPHLKQTTLFSFDQRAAAGSTPSTGIKPSKLKGTINAAHASDDSDASTPVKAKPARRPMDSALSDSHRPTSKLNSKPKPKLNAKAKKAGDEDRAETDVVLSIKPEFTKLISERKKNYEYRKYKLKESVERLWLYETAPTSAITYVMETSTPKVPGEVNDPSGIGNDDFDKGLKQSKYGYPVTGLFRLKRPLTTTQLKERFDIAVPQGWRYATRKLVEEVGLEAMERVF
ncbi:hypothetical protein C8Q73DRAFT_710015 [Cubamyces lactineus]|nr:hypothetical protein C8Q73DRAFT_710015 [Cubamyces lactineus]